MQCPVVYVLLALMVVIKSARIKQMSYQLEQLSRIVQAKNHETALLEAGLYKVRFHPSA